MKISPDAQNAISLAELQPIEKRRAISFLNQILSHIEVDTPDSGNSLKPLIIKWKHITELSGICDLAISALSDPKAPTDLLKNRVEILRSQIQS